MRPKFQALAALAAVLVLAAVVGGQAIARGHANVSVQLLAINDFHGNLEPPTGSSGQINGTPAGGAEYLATHLSADVARNPNSLIVGAGDLIGASPLLSGLFHDEPTIEAMNAMKLSVTSVGNHEFDEGWTELLRMQNGGCSGPDQANKCKGGTFKGASFRYLSANVLRNPTKAQLAAVVKYNAGQKAKLKRHRVYCGKKAHHGQKTCKKAFRIHLKPTPKPTPLLPPYAVRTIGGVKIGFIGETLKGTPQIVTPTGVVGLTFLDEASTANAYAKILQKQGVNAIVLLIHQGGQQNGGADPNGCTNFSGDLLPIIGKLSPAIKVVVSAHTHQYYNCTFDGHLVTSASSFGRMITRLDLTIDNKTDQIVTATADNEIVTRDVAKDATQTAIIDKYKTMAAPIANRVVGSVAGDITRSTNRSGESALGDVIADAQLASTSPTSKGGAVVAFMNPGGIRADIVANQQTGGEAPGQVTYSELFTVQPFNNVMTVLTLTGQQIKDLLEQQFDNPSGGQQRFLQVSNGFTYSYKLNAPAGQHVDAASIKINGTPIDLAKAYRVAENNFLATGGDGFTVFKQGTDQLGGDIDLDALVAYFQAKSPVAPGPQNRFARTD
ncbi:MAG TPA: bifunctional metallophosphatase/5'-nucleotidase [Gaiellaceae bacterium]